MNAQIRARVVLKSAIKAGLGTAALGLTPLWNRPGTLRVLYYHRVNDHPRRSLGLFSQEVSVSTRAFARQLDYLEHGGYTVLSADEVEWHLAAGTPFPPRAVLLTFDDGYADNYDHAFPLLARLGLPALIFLVTDFVEHGRPFPWDRGSAPACNRSLSWDQVREMSRASIAFGSHTKSHAHLDRLPPAALAAELQESRAVIEQETGHPVAFLAYPRGDSSLAVESACRKAGYRGAFTTIPGANAPGCDPFRLRRIEVSASDPLPVFALKLRGALDMLWLKETPAPRRLRAWVVRRLYERTAT